MVLFGIGVKIVENKTWIGISIVLLIVALSVFGYIQEVM